MYSLAKFCVVCLNRKEEYHKIISRTDDPQLFNKLHTCDFVTDFLDINANLHICNKCIDTLHVAYEFINMCRKNTIVLRHYIAQLKHVIAAGKCETEREQIYSEPVINLISNLANEEKSINTEEATLEEEQQCIVKEELLVDPLDVDLDKLMQAAQNMNDELILHVKEEIPINSQNNYLDTNRYVMPLKPSAIHHIEIKQEYAAEGAIESCINQHENSETKFKQICNESVKGLNPDHNELKVERDNINEEEEAVLELEVEECIVKEEIHSNELLNDDVSREMKCYICRKFFTCKSDFTSHMSTHTTECTVCKEKFNSVSHLNRHALTHTVENRYVCTVCEKAFKDSSTMKRHMRIHGEKKYKCTVCAKRFTNSGAVKPHMHIHTGEKKFECTVCHKRFAQASYVKIHMRYHTGEKKFKCTVCEKRFTLAGDLTKHMRLHTGEKIYQCPLCEKRFAYSSHLNRHIVAHNDTE